MPVTRYGFERWGHGLYEVMENGNVGLKNPYAPAAPALSLHSIVEDLDQRGIVSPVLIRVVQYLQNSIDELQSSFADAIARHGYQAPYRGVFPIKVNQQAHVVDEIVRHGQQYHYGLEAGSKPELVVALSQPLSPEALIVCNGVKDEEFIHLAAMSRQIGFNTVVAIESPREVETIIKVYQETGFTPWLGVRIKLTHQTGGKWQASSGDRSTFGLNTSQLMRIVARLREAGLLDQLVLQHSHLGSQIPDILDIRHAVTEACRYYTELSKIGVPLRYLDLGGGLGVDYTGENTSSDNSINYNTAEYCANIIETVAYATDEAGLEHPTIITESGRAVVARSAILVTHVLEETRYDADEHPNVEDGEHHLLHDLAGIESYLSAARLQECVNDALFYRSEMRALFRRGHVTIEEMAKGEQYYLYLISRVKRLLADNPGIQTGADLDEHLARSVDIYRCNFSLFQSVPDTWAIGQLHPIAPLQRLNEAPTRSAILADITCDSDGKINHFIVEDGTAPALPVHELDDRPYYLGVFMIGAYQETLGDLHNLFGDTHVATISLKPDNSGFNLIHELEGDKIAEVMSYVEYDPKTCMDNFRKRVDDAVANGHVSGAARKDFTNFYKSCIEGYTYYE